MVTTACTNESPYSTQPQPLSALYSWPSQHSNDKHWTPPVSGRTRAVEHGAYEVAKPLAPLGRSLFPLGSVMCDRSSRRREHVCCSLTVLSMQGEALYIRRMPFLSSLRPYLGISYRTRRTIDHPLESDFANRYSERGLKRQSKI